MTSTAYKVEARSSGPGTSAVMKAPSKPKMSDFDLQNIRIENAENGLIVECSYRMKSAVEQAMKGKKDGYVDYDVRNPSVKKVFTGEEASAIQAALHSALNGKKEAVPAKPKSNAKVRIIR